MISLNKVFIYSSCFFILGVFLNNIFLHTILSFLSLSLIVIFLCNFFLYTKFYHYILVSIIVGFSFGIFISFINLYNIEVKNNILSNYNFGEKYDLEFEIKSISKVDDYQVEYVSELKKIDSRQIDKNIYLLSVIPKNFKLEKGNIIYTNAKLYEINNYNDFDYKNYLLSKNIYFKTYIYNLENIGKNESNSIITNIDKLRQKFLYTIYQIYPKEEAIYLGGILLGARESMDKDLKQDFNNSGLTHIIAVSGFNITIIIIFISFIIKYFPIWLRVIIVSISVILFTFLVGPSAPVIRASIMGLVAYYAISSGRKGDTISILLFSLLIMVIISPFSLNYDVSLHLSFLAVLGIIFTQKFFSKLFYFLPNFLSIKEAIVMTFSALVFTLPVMIFNFGQLSIISPISNLLVIWTIPIAMLFGFISILLYLISPVLGIYSGYIGWIFLKYDIEMVKFFGNLNFSTYEISLGEYNNYFMLLYYVIILFLVFYFRRD